MNHILEYEIFNKYDSYRDLSYSHIIRESLPYQLHSEDRNSMLNSIEARIPFLDFPLCDFVFSLLDSYKINRGRTKRLLKDCVIEFLPKKIINRNSKMEFVAPEREFMYKNQKDISIILRNP